MLSFRLLIYLFIGFPPLDLHALPISTAVTVIPSGSGTQFLCPEWKVGVVTHFQLNKAEAVQYGMGWLCIALWFSPLGSVLGHSRSSWNGLSGGEPRPSANSCALELPGKPR